jgi:hypothetical protein
MMTPIGGGARWVPEGAGSILKSLFSVTPARKHDPRTDILVDVGLVLGNKNDVTIDNVQVLRSYHSDPAEHTMYLVLDDEAIVFDAIVTKDNIEYGHNIAGSWKVVLAGAANRKLRRKKKVTA